MPKIIDIKIIKGRRAEIIEEDNRRNNILRKCAEAEYAEYKRSSSQNKESIEEWVHARIWTNKYQEVYEKPLTEDQKILLKKAGITIPKKTPEVSIEQKILSLIKDGWETKGELILSGNEFFQTMVLYEGSALTITEDLLSLEKTDEPVLKITEVTPQITTD